MMHGNQSTSDNEPAITLTHRMLALILLATCVTSAVILSFMPIGLFLILTLAACLGWFFHKPLLSFLSSLIAERQRDIQPNRNEQVINFQQGKGFHKDSTLRALYGKAANHPDIGDDNIIRFPHSAPSNNQQ